MPTIVYTTGPIDNFVTNRSNTIIVKVRNGNLVFPATATVTIFSVLATNVPINTQTVTIPPNSSVPVQSPPPFLGVPVEYEVVVQVFTPGLPSDVLVGVYGRDIFNNLNPGHRVLHSEMQVIGFTP